MPFSLLQMALGSKDVQTMQRPLLMRSTLLLAMPARCRARHGCSGVLRNPESWDSRGHEYVSPAIPQHPASCAHDFFRGILFMPEPQPSFCVPLTLALCRRYGVRFLLTQVPTGALYVQSGPWSRCMECLQGEPGGVGSSWETVPPCTGQMPGRQPQQRQGEGADHKV